MSDREYKVYYNGRLAKKIIAVNRGIAIKKAKGWFYRQRKASVKNKIQGKARLSLVVSDLHKEVNYHPHFDTIIDENNFLARSDIRRIVKESKGRLKQTSKKELRQLERTKRFREADSGERIKQLLIIPLLHRKGKKNYYYSITKDGHSRYIKLDGDTPDDCVAEIKEKGLSRIDESKNAFTKAIRLRLNCEAAKKFMWVIKVFDSDRMRRSKYENSTNVTAIEIIDGVIVFNPYWVMRTSEKEIIIEMRNKIREAEKK